MTQRKPPHHVRKKVASTLTQRLQKALRWLLVRRQVLVMSIKLIKLILDAVGYKDR